jgi:hypothetical protein
LAIASIARRLLSRQSFRIARRLMFHFSAIICAAWNCDLPVP